MPLALVALLLGAVALGCLLALRRETHNRLPRRIALLRCASALVLAVLLLAPVLSHQTLAQRPAQAVVLVDCSGSMAVRDPGMSASLRLDEAQACGFLPPDARPLPWRDAAAAASDFERALDALAAACQGPLPQAEAAEQERLLHQRWSLVAPALAGDSEAGVELPRVQLLFQRLEGVLRGGVRDPTLASDLAQERPHLEQLVPHLREAQNASDAALLAGADPQSPLAQHLALLATCSREQRVRLLLEHALVPALGPLGVVSTLALADGCPALGEQAPQGSTDFAAPLESLARSWARSQPPGSGVVLVLSDGRQTAGGDPATAARALASSGLPVYGVCIGDPEPPHDAVVSELQGPQEVFKGETVRLDAHLRITGYGQAPWDLVFERDGRELERRSVRGDGSWQIERFEHPDSDPGLHTWRARLEKPKSARETIRPGGGLQREVWIPVPGSTIAQVRRASLQAATETSRILDATSMDARENYAERWRGWVVPPASGTYTFWISSDDAGVLRLSPGSDPGLCQDIASVPDWCPPGTWDRYRSQRSEPVQLEAGTPYYLEVLHKQGLGSAHCAIGWQLPDASLERPIPAMRLAPWPSGMLEASNAYPPEASTENNQADCAVAVVDDPLHVLVLDQEPRWDDRLLVTLFERDPRSVVDCRYRSALLRQPSHALLPATQDELDSFDVVVLGDLQPDELTAEDQSRLERFVAERNGFLILQSGQRGMPAGFGLGGLATLLPVRIPAMVAAPHPTTLALPTTGTSTVVDSPITAILDDPGLNRHLWPALPPIQWYLADATPKPGADVLLEAQDPGHSPVVVTWRYGSGRVLWIATDETWRWRDRVGERVHQAFWLQAVRWGLGGRLRGHDARLVAGVDRQLIGPGGRIELLARTRTSGGLISHEPVTATIHRLDSAGEGAGPDLRVDLHEVHESAGLFAGSVHDLGEGRWRIAFRSSLPELAQVEESREVLVRAPADAEGVELAADPAGLARLASAGGGRSVDCAGLPALLPDLKAHLHPAQVPTSRTWQVWGGYGPLALLVLLLLSEWILRRKAGLP